MHDDRKLSFVMTALQVTIIGGVIVSLVATVSSRLWQWITRRTKPKFSHETEIDVRATLNRTEHIFNSATSFGGRLAHPWKLDYAKGDKDNLFTLTDIENDLRAASARIADKKFSKSIRTIKEQLRKVNAARPSNISTVEFGDMPESASQVKVREKSEKFASTQYDAARKGLIATEVALALLDKKSANL